MGADIYAKNTPIAHLFAQAQKFWISLGIRSYIAWTGF